MGTKRGERKAKGHIDRERYLEKRLQMEITKNCAISEVCRAYPEHTFTMIKFLDEVDAFWDKALSRTLEEWRILCETSQEVAA